MVKYSPSWYTENSSTPPSFISNSNETACYQNSNMDGGPPWHPQWNDQYCHKGGGKNYFDLYKKYKTKYINKKYKTNNDK